MIFSTYWFFAFTFIVLPVYWLLWKPWPRKIWLAVACMVFHGHFAGAAGVIPIIILGLMTYLCGLSRNKAACLCAISINVLALCFYKYTQFFTMHAIAMLNPAWGDWLWTHAQGVLPSAPPLAISFFAFEFVHYLYDIRHGAEPVRHPVHFLLFAIFFPSLVAGPIKRFEKFIPSLQEGVATHSSRPIMEGVIRIGVGMFKKLVIADNLTMWINYQVPRFHEIDGSTRRLIFLAIGMRILMDFSGYSDIALGFARAMGITIPENFNWPYFATNIQDFWRRWHISLSSWIRDYVYIPLGGGRHGKARTLVNGLLAFTLCGLWHGAAWNFAFWGIYHGLGLVGYRLFHGLVWSRVETVGSAFVDRWWFRWPHVFVSWLLTQAFVFVGWMFFFYPVSDAWKYLHMMFH